MFTEKEVKEKDKIHSYCISACIDSDNNSNLCMPFSKKKPKECSNSLSLSLNRSYAENVFTSLAIRI